MSNRQLKTYYKTQTPAVEGRVLVFESIAVRVGEEWAFDCWPIHDKLPGNIPKIFAV
jgi:hypothetical protein